MTKFHKGKDVNNVFRVLKSSEYVLHIIITVFTLPSKCDTNQRYKEFNTGIVWTEFYKNYQKS